LCEEPVRVTVWQEGQRQLNTLNALLPKFKRKSSHKRFINNMLIIAECKRRIRMEGEDDRVEGEVGRCEEEDEGWVGHGGEMDLEIEERK
jgi:hypothetical protein